MFDKQTEIKNTIIHVSELHRYQVLFSHILTSEFQMMKNLRIAIEAGQTLLTVLKGDVYVFNALNICHFEDIYEQVLADCKRINHIISEEMTSAYSTGQLPSTILKKIQERTKKLFLN